MIKKVRDMINLYSQDGFVLVYQMGKVGSDGMCRSLGTDKCEHVHTFYGFNPNSKFLSPNKINFKSSISFWVKRIIIKTLAKKRKIKIITLVRDPEKRDPSMFFQDIDGYIRKERSISYGNYIRFNSGGISELCKLYLDRYDFDYGLNWLDDELKKLTDIDLYKEDFESGICRSSNECFDVLCLRMDKINENEGLISEFVGRPIRIVESNRSQDKWYSKLYADFLTELCLPDRIKDKYTSSKLSRWISGNLK